MRSLVFVVLLLSASCTTVSADGLQDPRRCSRYVDLFLNRTEHARPPADASQAAHGNFEISEAGQLELSNSDKEFARKVLSICEQESADALARAKRAMKPWYRRVFS